MKLSIIILTILVISTAKQTYSQSDTLKPKVFIYDGDTIEVSTQPDEVKIYKNVIKINPLLFIQGDVPIYFERMLSQFFSLELGLGITGKNHQLGFFREDVALSFDNDRIESKRGHSIKTSLRYYFDESAPEEFYIALEYGYRKYVFEYTQLEEMGVASSNTFETERIIGEFKVISGRQVELYKPEGIFIEYYWGIGWQQIQEVQVYENVDYNGSTSEYSYFLEPLSENRPAYYLGLKLGYAF